MANATSFHVVFLLKGLGFIDRNFFYATISSPKRCCSEYGWGLPADTILCACSFLQIDTRMPLETLSVCFTDMPVVRVKSFLHLQKNQIHKLQNSNTFIFAFDGCLFPIFTEANPSVSSSISSKFLFSLVTCSLLFSQWHFMSEIKILYLTLIRIDKNTLWCSLHLCDQNALWQNFSFYCMKCMNACRDFLISFWYELL